MSSTCSGRKRLEIDIYSADSVDKALCLVSKGNTADASCHLEVWDLAAETDTQYTSIISSECELHMALTEMLKPGYGA